MRYCLDNVFRHKCNNKKFNRDGKHEFLSKF